LAHLSFRYTRADNNTPLVDDKKEKEYVKLHKVRHSSENLWECFSYCYLKINVKKLSKKLKNSCIYVQNKYNIILEEYSFR